MRITHNARPWEPACIRSHAGFVWTADRDQPSVTPQTATKGFSSLTCGGSFRQSTFPRYPEFSIYRRKRFYNNAAMTISYSRRMIRNERTFTRRKNVTPWYRRGDVNVFVDDPIVGKLENLLGFFLRSEKQHCYYWRGIIVPEKQTSVALVWRRIMPP